jgi:hypothetical protein
LDDPESWLKKEKAFFSKSEHPIDDVFLKSEGEEWWNESADETLYDDMLEATVEYSIQ